MPKISEYQALLFRSLPIIKGYDKQREKKVKKDKKKRETFWMIF